MEKGRDEPIRIRANKKEPASSTGNEEGTSPVLKKALERAKRGLGLGESLRNQSWAKEVAQKHDSTVEQVGNITEGSGIVPVFLDETAKEEMLTHWQRGGSVNEVGGYAVGIEGEHDGHKYLRVTKIIPDMGIGGNRSSGHYQFGHVEPAISYINTRHQYGEHLVIIGSVHTHPKGWSGQITGEGGDASMFDAFEDSRRYGGDDWSEKRSHIVITPDGW